MAQTTVFVTGGTGLVGAHLLLQLAKEGLQVRALKRKDSDLNQVKSIFGFYKAEPCSVAAKLLPKATTADPN